MSVRTAILLVAAVFMGMSASAQDSSQNKVKIKDVQKKENKDLDKEITNPNLRATTGSLSKWSAQTTFNYQGGSADTPFGGMRPNIYGDPDVRANTSINGDISLKRRLTDHVHMNAGTGLSLLRPFGGEGFASDGSAEDGVGDFDVNNPYLSASYVGKIGRFQTVLTGTITQYTWAQQRDAGLQYQYSISPNFLTTVGKWTLGTAFSFRHLDWASGRVDGQQEAAVGMFPYSEYMISDKFQWRAVYGFFNWRHRNGGNAWNLRRNPNYVSTGLVSVISRDIVLYPNIQFIPEQAKLEDTNVALRASVNFF